MNRHFTEKEAFVNNSLQLFKLNNLKIKDKEEFQELSNFLSVYVHMSKRKDLEWVWGNDTAVKAVGTPSSEDTTFEIIQNISNSDVVNNYKKIVDKYNARNDWDSTCTFFQRIFLNEEWTWIITNKIITSHEDYLCISHDLKDLDFVGKYLMDKLDNTFNDINAWQKFLSLSKREKEILKLVASGRKSKDISDLLSISSETVYKHRENINKKLDTSNLFELIKFTESFELISAF